MPTVLDVEKQQFEFGDSWTVAFKYDDSNYYRRKRGPQALQGVIEGKSQSTRAMDVVAFHSEAGLLLLEAKDFRGHRIENQDRITTGELVLEVALKARDTVAGLVGAARCGETEFNSTALYQALKKAKSVSVVLWVEDDLQRDERRARQQLSTLSGLLKERLSWLNVRAFAHSTQGQAEIPDLIVRNLPGAGQS